MTVYHRMAPLADRMFDLLRDRRAFLLNEDGAIEGSLDTLRSRKYAVVVTFRRNGHPVPSPVWFALDDCGRAYFHTTWNSGKLKRLRRDNRVLIAPSNVRGKPIGPAIKVFGRVLSRQEGERAEEALAATYGAGRKVFEFFLGAPDDMRGYVEVAPRWGQPTPSGETMTESERGGAFSSGAVCDECGFDWTAARDETVRILQRVASNLRKYVEANPDEEDLNVLRRRPDPHTWSAVECIAHMTDGIAWYEGRIQRILTEPSPSFTPFDVDDACERGRYNERLPARVLADVERAAESLSEVLSRLTPQQLQTTGIGSDGGKRTIIDLARRAAHEAHHHLYDVARVLRSVRDS